MRNADSLGLYISVPFCRSKCTYCNFASGVYPAAEHRRYVDRLIEDLNSSSAWAERLGVALPRRVDSIYFGGGTPTLLEPDLIVALFSALRSAFQVDPRAEITMECAPGQLGDDTLEAMVASGVNRVSLGVQSFVDREAAVSGRLHTRATILSDLERIRGVGIANLNVDLIAGLAGQTMDSWMESLSVLIDADVPHASIYMLEVDEDSRLGRELIAHGTRYHAGLVPTDDAVSRMYSIAIERLAEAGLAQYEISNFARPGFESRHNLRYWQRRPYLGIGLDASSALQADLAATWGRAGALLRATMTSALQKYLAGPSVPEQEWLSPMQQQEEAWFLGLRMNAGVRMSDIEREFGSELVRPALEVVRQLVGRELLVSDGENVRLTDEGRLLSNDVFAEFIGSPNLCTAAAN